MRVSNVLRAAAQRTAGALLLVVTMGAGAYAGPPFQVDDPEPTPYRHYEVYLNTQYQHASGSMTGSAPALEINYGLMPNVQFSVTTRLAANRESGSRWHAGFGDTEAALKMRFVQESASRPQIAFYPCVVIPSGNAESGLGEGHVKLFLPLWAQKSFGRWTVFGGGGVHAGAGEGQRNSTFGGVAVQREVSSRLSYGAEIFHETADTVGGNGSTGFNLGMTRGLDNDRHKLLFSIGRSFRGSNSLSTYAAYQLNLGPKNSGAADEQEQK